MAGTPEADIKEARKFSWDPAVELSEVLKPELTLGFSAFYWLPHCLGFYGSLAYIKLEMEKWALADPKKRRMVRAGTFFSQSVRGIALLMRRLMKKTDQPEILELKAKFEASDKPFQDFFIEHAWESEGAYYQDRFDGPHTATHRAGLVATIQNALTADGPAIHNTIGNWSWTDTTLPDDLSPELKSFAE